MQIKTIIDNIHFIDIMFYISALFFFFLICPAEIGVRLIHACILYAIIFGNIIHALYILLFRI